MADRGAPLAGRAIRAQHAAVSSAQRPRWVLIVLLVAIAVGIVWYLRRAPSGAAAGSGANGPHAAAPAAAATAVGHAGEAPVSQDAAAAPRSDARARRDALREQILRQLAQRPAGGSGAPPPGAASDPPSGGLHNRLDDRHQPVVDGLNRDFMPLASECIEQAQQRAPRLTGMIALSLETVADEQLGAVVDVAEPGARNEVADPLLFECLRESAFSLSLPPPPTGGRMKTEITMPIDPPQGSGGRP
jgi:hypothetical protein